MQKTDDMLKSSILVVGDLILDKYWYCNVAQVSPEAPVPLARFERETNHLGGAGRIAENCCLLGANTTLVGVLGNDQNASIYQGLAEGLGIELLSAECKMSQTLTRTRLISDGHQLIRMDFEDLKSGHSINHLMDYVENLSNKNDVMIISGFQSGSIHGSQSLIELAKKKEMKIVVDPKCDDFEQYRGATIFTPNLKEFVSVMGPVSDRFDLERKAVEATIRYDLGALLLTLGADGMLLVTPDKKVHAIPSAKKEVYDVTGAGDAVVAAIAVAFAEGEDMIACGKFANQCAGIVVSKSGPSTISKQELIDSGEMEFFT